MARDSQISAKTAGSQTVTGTQKTQVVNDTQFVVPAADDPTADFAPSPPKRRRSLQEEPQGLARNLQTLISAKPRSYFDVACQVIAVFDYEEHVALRVWDGSMPRKGLALELEHAANVEELWRLATAIDADLEAKAKNYFVDIVCYQEHAEAARSCQPLDLVLLINLHAYVNKTPMEAFTMHSGTRFNRGIYRLRSDRLIAPLQKRIAAALVEIENKKDEVDSFYEDIEESEIRLGTDFGSTQQS
ncbi:protection of telomeres protein 1 [Aphelenchoides avenae]|nr:protection of telomeres protein 1 [Aphelenchus avenae]